MFRGGYPPAQWGTRNQSTYEQCLDWETCSYSNHILGTNLAGLHFALWLLGSEVVVGHT